ncbi:orotate phosphoribosyltransferase [Nitrospira sp. BLG_2]|uniref:orotate phosphoribosyltransferase n=1 Tax=Nitrospira sp. BLG_2 TaxID=3397507 RepID=UPI003B99F4EE
MADTERGGPLVTVRDQLTETFHATQSFKWDRYKGFKLASGEISPFYVDCRALLGHPEARRLVAKLAYEALTDIEFDCLGGLELGAIPIAVTISDFACAASRRRLWRTFVVRKQPKDHGLGKLIEGTICPGDRALIVDDVLTSGGSLLKAIEVAREAGLRVNHALVIVDRQEQDGKARVEREQVQLISLVTIQELMNTMKKA